MGLGLEVLTPTDDAPYAATSYSGFARWRERIVAAVGLGDLRDYEGFGGHKPWPSAESEPLIPLLNHSDCDGELWGWEINGLADRLRAVIRLWPEDDPYRTYGEKVATICEVAEREGGVVVFG